MTIDKRPVTTIIRAHAMAVLAAALAISACAETQYVPYGEGPSPDVAAVSPTRTVEHEASADFLLDPPRCVLLAPIVAKDVEPKLVDMIERAFIPNLAMRAGRVVSGGARDQLARYRGLDPTRVADRRAIAAALNCDAIAEVEVKEAGADFLVVWSNLRLGLEARLIRADSGVVLWRARHLARRSDGGLPLGIGGIASVYSAASLAMDEDQAASLVDDATRRIFATWVPPRRLGDAGNARN
jgi:hypothetical protein